MAAATLTAKGQVVIPAEIRARYQLSPGTQVEFVDEGGTIRLLVRRRVTPSEPAAGHGMVKAMPRTPGAGVGHARLLRSRTAIRPASDAAGRAPLI